MKNLVKILVILLIFAGGIYIVFYIRNEKEELEVINKDVSINIIKSILEIETQNTESELQVPLGCKDNTIYLLKYDNDKQKYDNRIYILKEDKTVEQTEVIVPDKYISEKNLNVYGDKIFNNYGYFNWSTGTEVELLSYESNVSNDKCYSVGGNSDFILLKNSKEYTLCNIKSNEMYTYKCSDDSKSIKAISFNKNKEEFYVLDKLNNIDEVIIKDKNFELENCNELQLGDNLINENGSNYLSSSNGDLYLGSGIVNNEITFNEEKKEFNIQQYNIDENRIEHLDSIGVIGYDKYYKDYVIVKKNDNENNNKTYLAKLTNDGFDILMEIEKSYGNDSILTIHMSDAQNVLINETYFDKENKTIKNKYSVYDLTDYFTQNEYVLNNDGTWSENENNANLKNTLRNIDDSERAVAEVNKNQPVKDIQGFDEKPIDNVEEINYVKVPNNNNDNTTNKNNNENKEQDYREEDPYWKKGNGDWYYYDDNDRKITGWLKANDKWYYFDENGVMQKNSMVVESEGEYEIGENGEVVDFKPKGNAELINQQKDNDSSNLNNNEDKYKEIDISLERNHRDRNNKNIAKNKTDDKSKNSYNETNKEDNDKADNNNESNDDKKKNKDKTINTNNKTEDGQDDKSKKDDEDNK